MPCYYHPIRVDNYDPKSSNLMNDFFEDYGQYIEEITVDDNPCWASPEISLAFSRWKPGSEDERVVREAQQRWRGIQKLISDGAIDRSKAIYSCRKFMDSRNVTSTSYPDVDRQAKFLGKYNFDEEKSFSFAVPKTVTNDSWIKMVNTILGKINEKEKEMTPNVIVLSIEKVVFHGPATIIFWKDKTKTIVKCMEGDTYDPEKAVLLACLEHFMGGKGPAKKWLKKMTEGAPKNSPNIVDSEDVPIGMSREREQAEFEKIKFQFRHKKFKKFVDKRAAMTGMDELEFMNMMNCFIHYTRKTALDWYDGVKPISDTAWKKICEAYPDILEDNNAR